MLGKKEKTVGNLGFEIDGDIWYLSHPLAKQASIMRLILDRASDLWVC